MSQVRILSPRPLHTKSISALTLVPCDHHDVAVPARHSYCDVVVLAMKQQVYRARTQAQVAQSHVVQEIRQHRAIELDLAGLVEQLQAKRGLQQAQGSRARPRLRRTSHRILGRCVALAAGEAAEELR